MGASQTDPGPLPTIGAWALGLAGVVHVLLAVQFLAFWWLEGWQLLVVGTMLVGGASAVALAWPLGQGSSRASIAGTVIAPALGLLSTTFGAYALWNLSFALYMLFAPPAAALATVLVPLAIAPCLRAERALAEVRERWGDAPFAGILRP